MRQFLGADFIVDERFILIRLEAGRKKFLYIKFVFRIIIRKIEKRKMNIDKSIKLLYDKITKQTGGDKMKDHGIIAEELFREGYNCSQAVLMAFEDVTGLEKETAAKLASSFGGGLGRMREVCGAVSGAAMVLGLLKGYSDPKSYEQKKAHYQLIQDFAARFKEKNGSIICRELLNGTASNGGIPEERTPEFYQKRPCASLIRQAAEILDEMLLQTDAP